MVITRSSLFLQKISVLIAVCFLCVLQTAFAGTVVGWGNNNYTQATPPDSNDFVAIAAGIWHSLALKSDGSIVGWGWDDFGQATPPDGNDFVAIAAGTWHGLALKSNDSVVGWGWNDFGQATPPDGNDFVAIAGGGNHSLALRFDGSIVGWGSNSYTQATPPDSNDFVAIAAGIWHSLALKSDGSIVCWGRNLYGETIPPDGNDFVAIAANGNHSLALRLNGSIVGWGSNDYGLATPPDGNDFVAIATGDNHSLALRSNGSIAGWGSNDYGQATPPQGSGFNAIAAGGYHSLAIKSNAKGVLQFKSGFDPNTYIFEDKIKGIDNSGHSGANSWDNLSDYLPWVLEGDGYFEGGSMGISTDPFDPNNHVLHLHTFEEVDSHARSQWSLEQEHNWYIEGGPNLFKQQFYRFRILIPERIKTLYSTSERAGWYMIWESHVWDFEPTRHGIYLFKLADSDHWGFRVVQQSSINDEYLYENVPYYDVEVPIGQWFTMEIFFKYDETDGEFYAAIQRDGQAKQTIADFKGQTKFGTKLHDQMMFKLYHDADYINRTSELGLDGIHQYYDDFEIWSDYPGENR
jgi:hypothetical protein